MGCQIASAAASRSIPCTPNSGNQLTSDAGLSLGLPRPPACLPSWAESPLPAVHAVPCQPAERLTWGSSRAGWPTRTIGILPLASASRSTRLSTATLEAAQASTRLQTDGESENGLGAGGGQLREVQPADPQLANCHIGSSAGQHAAVSARGWGRG